MNRAPQPEILDELPASDPRAVKSRRDLRRINGLMGNAAFLKNYVLEATTALKMERVRLAEIGGGDGNVAAQVARHLGKAGIGGALKIVDRQPVPANRALARMEGIGWSAETALADVFEWLERAEMTDIIIANLFLHHFENEQLRELAAGVARRCRVFAAVEPRRNRFALAAAGGLGLIGCNAVTRHDAIISVRAGFRGRELSELWPKEPGWTIQEARAGLFSHFFGAARVK